MRWFILPLYLLYTCSLSPLHRLSIASMPALHRLSIASIACSLSPLYRLYACSTSSLHRLCIGSGGASVRGAVAVGTAATAKSAGLVGARGVRACLSLYCYRLYIGSISIARLWVCRYSKRPPLRGGHFEYRQAHARAMDMPSATPI